MIVPTVCTGFCVFTEVFFGPLQWPTWPRPKPIADRSFGRNQFLALNSHLDARPLSHRHLVNVISQSRLLYRVFFIHREQIHLLHLR